MHQQGRIQDFEIEGAQKIFCMQREAEVPYKYGSRDFRCARMLSEPHFEAF